MDLRKSIKPIIQARGWGNWRVETIFRTNVQTAYNVGKFKQQKESGAKYLMYDAVDDSRTRPTHAALDGKVFPADDAIWQKWYPPNGFRCRCTTRGMSEAELKARGLKVEAGADWDGKMVDIGDGRLQALMPDPQFAHHPGQVMFGGIKPGKGFPTELPNLKGPESFRRRASHNIRPAELDDFPADQILPEGLKPESYWKEFVKAFGIALDGETVIRDPLGQAVIVSAALLKDVFGKSKIQKTGHGSFVRTFPGILQEPFEIWLTPTRYPDGRIVLRKRFVQLWKTPDKTRVGAALVFEIERGRWVGVTAFSPKEFGYMDEHFRRGVLLYGR
jgi:SPP1 gp7 family putative phage head morphogenesis protein